MKLKFLAQIFSVLIHFRTSDTIEPLFERDLETVHELFSYCDNAISAINNRINPPTLCEISIELRQYVCYTVAKVMIEDGINVIINHEPLEQENNLTCKRQAVVSPSGKKRMIFCDAVLVQRENNELIRISGFFLSRGLDKNAVFVYNIYPSQYSSEIARYVQPESRGLGPPYLTVIGHVRHLEYKKERLTALNEVPLYNPPFGTSPTIVYMPEWPIRNLLQELENTAGHLEEGDEEE